MNGDYVRSSAIYCNYFRPETGFHIDTEFRTDFVSISIINMLTICAEYMKIQIVWLRAPREGDFEYIRKSMLDLVIQSTIDHAINFAVKILDRFGIARIEVSSR